MINAVTRCFVSGKRQKRIWFIKRDSLSVQRPSADTLVECAQPSAIRWDSLGAQDLLPITSTVRKS